MTSNLLKENKQTAYKNGMDYNELMNCMRCGFCLPSCPTYAQTNQNEAASPRGRIALMKGVVDGLIESNEDVEKQLNLCLGCRACEPVCPSGVQYGHLLEDAKEIIENQKRRPLAIRLLRYAVFKQFFPKQNRIRFVHKLLWFYQKSRIQNVVRKLKLINILPSHLVQMEKILPTIASPKELNRRPLRLSAKGITQKTGCFFLWLPDGYDVYWYK